MNLDPERQRAAAARAASLRAESEALRREAASLDMRAAYLEHRWQIPPAIELDKHPLRR